MTEEQLAEKAALADLARTDKAAWLASLKATDAEAWYQALAASADAEPERFKAEFEAEQAKRAARIAAETAAANGRPIPDGPADITARAREIANARIQAEVKLCVDEVAAYTAAQDFVTDRLRSPATADWPWMNEIVIRPLDGKPCGRRLIGHVDSQNGFGAIVRSEWTVAIRVADDASGWTLEEIAVVDR